MKKSLVIFIKKLEFLSAVSCRLTQLTGKAKNPVHPKHLIKESKKIFLKYARKDSKVLDMGSNMGEHSFALSPRVKEIISADYNKKLLSLASLEANRRRITNITFRLVNFEQKMPFRDEEFDLILCLDILDHLKKRDQALNEIYRVLKPGGTLLLSVSNIDTSWKRLQKSVGIFYFADPDHKTEYKRAQLIEILNKHQFRTKQVDTISYDTPFAPLIDLVGGLSLKVYVKLQNWKRKQGKLKPEDCCGFLVAAIKS